MKSMMTTILFYDRLWISKCISNQARNYFQFSNTNQVQHFLSFKKLPVMDLCEDDDLVNANSVVITNQNISNQLLYKQKLYNVQFTTQNLTIVILKY